MPQTNTNSETIWECLGDTTDSKQVISWAQIQTQVHLTAGLVLIATKSCPLSNSVSSALTSFLRPRRGPGKVVSSSQWPSSFSPSPESKFHCLPGQGIWMTHQARNHHISVSKKPSSKQLDFTDLLKIRSPTFYFLFFTYFYSSLSIISYNIKS